MCLSRHKTGEVRFISGIAYALYKIPGHLKKIMEKKIYNVVNFFDAKLYYSQTYYIVLYFIANQSF